MEAKKSGGKAIVAWPDVLDSGVRSQQVMAEQRVYIKLINATIGILPALFLSLPVSITLPLFPTGTFSKIRFFG